jgi:hypothetical protein
LVSLRELHRAQDLLTTSGFQEPVVKASGTRSRHRMRPSAHGDEVQAAASRTVPQLARKQAAIDVREADSMIASLGLNAFTVASASAPHDALRHS